MSDNETAAAKIKLVEEEMGDVLNSILRLDREPPLPLFHYTDTTGICGILANKQLWATHYQHLNDSSEFRGAEKIIDEMASEIANMSGLTTWQKEFVDIFIARYSHSRLTKVSAPYVVSLSTNGNLLSQWRAYAGNGTGYSIGFPPRLMKGISDRNYVDLIVQLVECEYNEGTFRHRVGDSFRGAFSALSNHVQGHSPSVLNAVLRAAAARTLVHMAWLVMEFKNSSFEEEKEWRLVAMVAPGVTASPVKFRSGKNGILPYLQLDIAEKGSALSIDKLYVGPRHELEAGVNAASGLLDFHGYDGKSIACSSGIPFRG